MPSPAPAEAEFSTARPFSWRKRLFLAGLLFFLVLSLVGPYLYFAMVAESDLRAAIAEADRTDPGWRLLELEAKRPVIPDEENSAINLAKAKALLPAQWPIWDHAFAPEHHGQLAEDVMIFAESFENLEPEAQLSGRQIEALRKELKRAAAALDELYKIANKPHGRFPVTYPKDFISYSPSHDIGDIVRLLDYDILLRCQDRNP